VTRVRLIFSGNQAGHRSSSDRQKAHGAEAASAGDGGRSGWTRRAGAAWPVIRRTTGAGSGGDRRLTDAAHAETGFSAATELTGGWISVGTDAVSVK
jgi:hypothetical protein